MSGNYFSTKIDGPGVYGAITVSTTAVEAKVGASVLEGRKVLVITPTNGTVYWGYNSSVTVSTGTPIYRKQSLTLEFTDSVSVFLIAGSSTNVRINEIG